jgi:predicted unusual protein kinase regulating ubiquinone biosynthesis (AarF/ABC1/UbiB family)
LLTRRARERTQCLIRTTRSRADGSGTRYRWQGLPPGRQAAELRERTGDDGAVERFHEHTADRYAELLGNYRGVLMKVGQMLSLVDTDALSAAGYTHYQRALSRLHADAPAMEPAVVRDVLESELRSPSEYFAEFSDDPVAAASIGQVHRAVLRDGREVAIKIQYPGVAEAIREDLANTEMLASMLRFMTSAVGAVADFTSSGLGAG